MCYSMDNTKDKYVDKLNEQLSSLYNNRELSYMEIGNMEKACEDWTKAGKDGKYYIKKYCNK